MKPKKLVVVGNGMAGMACLSNILRYGKPFEVTVFGDETYLNYNRIGLSHLLAGEKEADELILNPLSWYQQNGVALRVGEKVTGIDRKRRVVITEAGAEQPYDKLLLATGSLPFIPPIRGAKLPGVEVFRTLEDTQNMIVAARAGGRAVVLGGGLLGLECARGLQKRGMSVSVVHLAGHLMEQQLDPKAGEVVLRAIKRLGISVLLKASTTAILGAERAEGVLLESGAMLPADLVVIACGIRPRVDLAKDCGLYVRKGIVVDDFMSTSDPDVFAVGECVEHRGRTYGLVTPLYEQGQVVAASLVGEVGPAYRGTAAASTLKVAGVDVFSAGVVKAAKHHEVVRYEDYHGGVYKRLLIRDGVLEGVVLVGDLSGSGELHERVRTGAMVGTDRHKLLFGEGGATEPDVLGAPGSTVVCGCLGVTKAALVQAITSQGLSSLKEVKTATRACTGCGSCAGQVQALLKHSAGASYVEAPKDVLCGCYDFSLQQLRTIAQTQKIKSVDELAQVYANDAHGCPTCKPALAFMMEELWCGDHQENRAHRFINDRVHANIQRDGTFSVIPRMRGGVTTPDELMRIARVAVKYDVPMVKVTGSQRIDLLGIKKEDLPRVWEELDMPSGHAYAKAVRMVKTCVGSQFCRYGTQDAIRTGIELETRLENLYTPAKVKLAVVACPRNCAEATVKDIGLVGVEGGWNVVVGGAAGKSVRKADDLCFVETEEEALDAVALFFQYYRENADYLERAYDFVERLGMEKIRAHTVAAPEEEKAKLRQRLARSKARAKDPWLERRREKTPAQFAVLNAQPITPEASP